MSKTILRTELKHLKRMLAPLESCCPVCATEDDMFKKPYPAKNCATSSSSEWIACPPSVQKRCKKLMPLMDKMASALYASIVAVEAELAKKEESA